MRYKISKIRALNQNPRTISEGVLPCFKMVLRLSQQFQTPEKRAVNDERAYLYLMKVFACWMDDRLLQHI
jgi:hypothetical protein